MTVGYFLSDRPDCFADWTTRATVDAWASLLSAAAISLASSGLIAIGGKSLIFMATCAVFGSRPTAQKETEASSSFLIAICTASPAALESRLQNGEQASKAARDHSRVMSVQSCGRVGWSNAFASALASAARRNYPDNPGEPEYGVEAVQRAFIVGNKQSGARGILAALAVVIFDRVASASTLDSFACPRTLRTQMCVAAHTRPHPVLPTQVPRVAPMSQDCGIISTICGLYCVPLKSELRFSESCRTYRKRGAPKWPS